MNTRTPEDKPTLEEVSYIVGVPNKKKRETKAKKPDPQVQDRRAKAQKFMNLLKEAAPDLFEELSVTEDGIVLMKLNDAKVLELLWKEACRRKLS